MTTLKLVAVYTDIEHTKPHCLYVGTDKQTISEMKHLGEFVNEIGFTPEFAVTLEDCLERDGYAVTSPWLDEIEFWVAFVVPTR